MFIHCKDNCVYQKDGICALKNVYSSDITANVEDIYRTGCVYYKEKVKKKKGYTDTLNTDSNPRGGEHRNNLNF